MKSLFRAVATAVQLSKHRSASCLGPPSRCKLIAQEDAVV